MIIFIFNQNYAQYLILKITIFYIEKIHLKILNFIIVIYSNNLSYIEKYYFWPEFRKNLSLYTLVFMICHFCHFISQRFITYGICLCLYFIRN